MKGIERLRKDIKDFESKLLDVQRPTVGSMLDILRALLDEHEASGRTGARTFWDRYEAWRTAQLVIDAYGDEDDDR